MSRLRMWQVWMATVVLSTGLTVVPGVAADSTQTFTGKASDAMCAEGGIAPADCVRACVQKGAKYALVVGDKVYTLDTSDQAALDQLNKLAWEEAKVTGTANGDTISVKSVTAAESDCRQVGAGEWWLQRQVQQSSVEANPLPCPDRGCQPSGLSNFKTARVGPGL